MDNSNIQLTINRIDSLDNMNLEDVSDYMEQNLQKHVIEYRNWADQFPYHALSVFTMAYSQKYIYIDYFVRCNFLRAVNYTNNSPVSDDSGVEFFMQLPGSPEYWNFEFNCIGTVNASHRERRDAPVRLTDEQIASIRRCPSCGTRPFEEMEGLFSWNLVVAIPFSLIGIDITAPDAPKQIRANFYKCAGKTSMPHFISWAPIDAEKPNFHRPDCFGIINLN